MFVVDLEERFWRPGKSQRGTKVESRAKSSLCTWYFVLREEKRRRRLDSGVKERRAVWDEYSEDERL